MRSQRSDGWDLAQVVADQTERCLAGYRVNPDLVEQDAGIEISSVEGGYGRKQLHELVQNGADALIGSSGRIALVLSETHLYCANEGQVLDERGIRALMASHLSIKRDDQIGRFGLGFKSVLGISDAPEIISRSVAIRFDRSWAEQLIRQVKPGAERTSVLRVAQAFDIATTLVEDPTLRRLMTWATTVVRLPLKGSTEWLTDAMVRFPPEFLLFAPHVSQLEIEGGSKGPTASWISETKGDRVVLRNEKGQVDEWLLFRQTFNPSERALQDAGEITGRKELTVTWAVPKKARSRTGKLWAYFPTNSDTTLSGIVNAPFKTNEDRHDILAGPYNEEILTTVLPQLISGSLSALVDSDDPCSLLEILPARGREKRSWADGVLNEPVMRAVADTACLPDLDGQLQPPDHVYLSPEFLIERSSWLERWVTTPGRPSNWVHSSVNKDDERRAKAVRLLLMKGRETAGLRSWLQALAQGAGVSGSGAAILLAKSIDEHEPDQIAVMRGSQLILTAAGTLQVPIVGRIFLPENTSDQGELYVHQDLMRSTEVVGALEYLGIRRLDQMGKLKSEIELIKSNQADPVAIQRLWELARRLQPEDSIRALQSGFGEGETPIMTMAHRPAAVWDALLPGTVVPADGNRDQELTIDIGFHAEDRTVLEGLGAVAEPRIGQPRAKEPWYEAWLAEAHHTYLVRAKGEGKRVSTEQIKVIQGKTFSRLDILTRLSEKGRAQFTAAVLASATDDWFLDSSNRALDVKVPFINPGIWWVRKHGFLSTVYGPQRVGDTFAPGPQAPSDILPVADISPRVAQALGLRPFPEAGDWPRILRVAEWALEISQLHRLYGHAALHNVQPLKQIKITRGSGWYQAAPKDCYVTDSEADYEALLASGHYVVLAENAPQSVALQDRWGLSDSSGMVNRTVLSAPSGEATPVRDLFPGLRAISANISEEIEVVPCSELATEIDMDDSEKSVTISTPVLQDGNTIYYLDSLDSESLLSLLNVELHLDLSKADLATVHDINQRGVANEKKRAVRSASSADEKLLLLAGESAIRRLLPPMAVDLAAKRAGHKLSGSEIVQMARAAHGGQLLKKLAPAIEERGIATPTQLAGGALARSWVRDFGLPDEFAGGQQARPPARQDILGPVELPPLHEYQSQSVDRLCRLLRPGGPKRGLLALPTGSGKTRVAVEAVVRHVRQTSSTPLVVWIAQTDELCEQAAEAWSYVWRAVGVPGVRLTMTRLWGQNEATALLEGMHLVIATDDKLDSVRRRGGYDWLTDADIVIVDEAHTSVSKTYTALFDWFKRGTRERNLPLIGLSATPYRGNNEEQTTQLVRRYDSNLITDGVFGSEDPHRYLQDRRILAQVKHLELEGTVLVPGHNRGEVNTPAAQLLDFKIDFEKVAADGDRNTRILDSLERLPTGTTALVFAASVQHADLLAAVLNSDGVPAASVSAFTPSGERRRIVQQFRQGEIRVITNYNVLSQGFDAPKVGAVYVARPTFSLNRYQQMIGRGLRGPLNGGSEEVLIVNIRDNIEAFGQQLAFHHFDELWRREAASV